MDHHSRFPNKVLALQPPPLQILRRLPVCPPLAFFLRAFQEVIEWRKKGEKEISRHETIDEQKVKHVDHQHLDPWQVRMHFEFQRLVVYLKLQCNGHTLF